MTIEHNVSLKPYNTLGVEARAHWFLPVTAVAALQEALAGAGTDIPVLVLGGGSNILFTRDFEGLVLHDRLRGIAVLSEDGAHVRVRAAGGEDWHGFVQWCLQQGFYGLENLSLIPGTVGAAPVQNIGAYGDEAGDRIERVEAVDLASGAIQHFGTLDCAFAYRSSIFKGHCRNRFFITAVTFRLSRIPRLVTSYADVRQTLAERRPDALTPQQLSDIICAIRRRKLPDPGDVPNVGSFFKNPAVSRACFHELKARFADIPAYPVADGRVKLAAGWMIDRCGWRGRRLGACGVYAGQALVLVNYGGATGKEIQRLAQAVQASVEARFGVRLEPEPLIL